MASKRFTHALWVVSVILFGLIILAGCAEKEDFPGVGNLPPETSIDWEILDTPDGHRAIHATWSGTDPDGVIDHFEVVMIARLTEEDLATLDYDALGWQRTTAVESTFVMHSGSRGDAEEKEARRNDIRALLVRAVDDAGAKDPAPPMAFQIGETGLPKVKIKVPTLRPIDPLEVCYRFYLQWEGWDPEGAEANLSYKYLIIPEADLSGGTWVRNSPGPRAPLPPLDYEGGTNHWCAPIGMWSHWVPADCTYVLDIDLSEYASTPENIMVFLTARNQAGAVLNENFYRTYNQDRNWFRCLPIPVCAGIRIHIDEQKLGRRDSYNQWEYENEVAYIYEGTGVHFRFWADEYGRDGRMATAYRYYFDDPGAPESAWDYWTSVTPLRREGSSPEWIAGFPPGGDLFSPDVGPHVFVIEVRDLVGVPSHCEFHLEVLEGPLGQTERLIYLVDDSRGAWMEPLWVGYEVAEDDLWADILDGYDYEVHDTGRQYSDAVSPAALGQASTVIWNVDWDLEPPETNLLEVCSELNNYLYSYVETGGNLIIIGKDPIYTHAYWHDGTPDPDLRPALADLDFSPRLNAYDSTWTYNFNWDVFGIVEMGLPAVSIEFSTLHPCEAGWTAIEAGTTPSPPYWDGTFNNGFFITEVRTDIAVQTLYGVVPLDSNGDPMPPDCTRWLAVYVPSDGVRGHAAYVGVPPLLCDHDQIRTMIRQLLDLFGEESAGR